MVDTNPLFLEEADVGQIERAHPDGLTSAQIISIFQNRGIKFSEATFRKYVQVGLLPRSRRVGSKGKHRGSRGIYPCATVRRINSIKSLMAQSFTLEQIQQSFNAFKERIDAVEGAIDDLLRSFEREVGQPQFDVRQRLELDRDVRRAQDTARQLVREIRGIESRLTQPRKPVRVAGDGQLTDL